MPDLILRRASAPGMAALVLAAALLLSGRPLVRAAVRLLRWAGAGEQAAWSSPPPVACAPVTDAPLILAFGDSLIAGYGLAPGEGFVPRLEALLRTRYPRARVIGAGRCGDTTGSARWRLRRVLSMLGTRPDLAIVQLGANDLIRGASLRSIRINLERVIDELGRAGIPVLLAEIRAPLWFGTYGRACAAIYARLARRPQVRRAPFFPPGVFANPRFCLPDRIHPNAEASAIIAEAFLPAVDDYLGALRAAAG